ncbi:MAG: magnesium transporter CorA family protein [Dehalococcoidia bacterium]
MIRTLHQCDGKIEEVTPAEACALARDPGHEGVLWVDLEAEPAEPARELLQNGFGFHYLAVDDCLNVRVDTPKIDDYGDYIFIVAQRLSYNAESDELVQAELNVFLGQKFVISYHDQPFPELDQMNTRIVEGAQRLERGADYLARTILDVVVDDYLPVVEAIEEDAAELEERIIRTPSAECIEAARLLRRNALNLRRALGPMRDVMNRISRGEFPLLVREKHQIYFRDVYDHVVRVEEMASIIREQADLAITSYLSVTNNKLNEAMRLLAIVTVIFAPPTLVTGVFGTNFALGLPYGEEWGVELMFALFVVLDLAVLAYLRWRRLI